MHWCVEDSPPQSEFGLAQELPFPPKNMCAGTLTNWTYFTQPSGNFRTNFYTTTDTYRTVLLKGTVHASNLTTTLTPPPLPKTKQEFAERNPPPLPSSPVEALHVSRLTFLIDLFACQTFQSWEYLPTPPPPPAFDRDPGHSLPVCLVSACASYLLPIVLQRCSPRVSAEKERIRQVS